MNIKTTLILLALTLGMLLAWQTLYKESDAERETRKARPLLAGLLADSVSELEITDGRLNRLPTPLTLRRGQDGTWTALHRDLNDGKGVPARQSVVATILQGVESIHPRRVLEEDPKDSDMGRFGLASGDRIGLKVKTREDKTFDVWLGSEIGTGDIACRAGDSGAVFAVPKELAKELVPELRYLPDPALLHLNVLDVRKLRVERPGELPLEIERSFSRWFLNAPVSGVPADNQRCDQLRSAILGLVVTKHLDKQAGASLNPPLIPEPARLKVTLTVEGQTIPTVLRFGREVAEGGVAVEVSGPAQALALVSPEALKPLMVSPAQYRDRHLFDVSASQIQKIEVQRARNHPLKFARFNKDLFRVEFQDLAPDAHPHFTDQVAFGQFTEQLLGLELASYLPKSDGKATLTKDTSDLVVKLSLAGMGSKEIQTREVLIGSPNDQGVRPVQFLGQEGVGTVTDSAVKFLTEPFWSFSEFVLYAERAYYAFGRVEITQSNGETARFRGDIPGKQQDIIFYKTLASGEKRVPDELKRRFVEKLIGKINVSEWLGLGLKPAMGFDKPFLKVRWLAGKGADVSGLGNLEQGAWKELLIGSVRPDGKYYAVMNEKPHLVLLVEASELTPILNLANFE